MPLANEDQPWDKFMNRQLKIVTAVAALAIASGMQASTAGNPAATGIGYGHDAAKSAGAVQAGVALQGYDPVGYFMHQQALKGDESMTAVVAGKTYRFVMQQHIAMFTADPERYLPQFDGLCAMCLAEGRNAAGDPTQFVVHDNKLYFNADATTQAAFANDIDNNIAHAQSNFDPAGKAAAIAAPAPGTDKGNIAGPPTEVRIDVARYTQDGELMFPDDTDHWVVMGASLGMGYNEQNFDPNAPGSFVLVSMEPKAYEYFKKTGHFADGTMFTRNSYDAARRMSTNRAGFVMGDYSATEIHVVDRKRFKDGFNFAIFGPGQTQANILPNGNGCVSCHTKNGAYEAVFAQFYPTIRHRIPAAALAASLRQEKP
jgi:YHS domain-containing protein